MRTFKHRSKYIRNLSIITCIERWEWTKSRGLYVIFTDGIKCKSSYTLPELIETENPIEVI
jgi:hypothetical protein